MGFISYSTLVWLIPTPKLVCSRRQNPRGCNSHSFSARLLQKRASSLSHRLVNISYRDHHIISVVRSHHSINITVTLFVYFFKIKEFLKKLFIIQNLVYIILIPRGLDYDSGLHDQYSLRTSFAVVMNLRFHESGKF